MPLAANTGRSLAGEAKFVSARAFFQRAARYLPRKIPDLSEKARSAA